MARLSAQQRAEIVQLYLQGESVITIVRQTGHDHKTVLRWVRPRYRRWLAAGQGSLRSTIEGHDADGGQQDQTIGASQKGQRSRSTRRVAATPSSRGALISHTLPLHSEGVRPYVQPQVPLQRRGDKKWRLRSRMSRKNVIRGAVCLLLRRHLCVIPQSSQRRHLDG